jgi:hypothetical protein
MQGDLWEVGRNVSRLWAWYKMLFEKLFAGTNKHYCMNTDRLIISGTAQRLSVGLADSLSH